MEEVMKYSSGIDALRQLSAVEKTAILDDLSLRLYDAAEEFMTDKLSVEDYTDDIETLIDRIVTDATMEFAREIEGEMIIYSPAGELGGVPYRVLSNGKTCQLQEEIEANDCLSPAVYRTVATCSYTTWSQHAEHKEYSPATVIQMIDCIEGEKNAKSDTGRD